MPTILDTLKALPAERIPAGTVLLEEGASSDRIYVLGAGVVEVYRGETTIALVGEYGALFGEMSVVLDIAHTASVRTASDCSVHVIENARQFLQSNPALAFPIAQLLARRLQHATTYLVDLKEQFADRADHFNMVDEVLEALLNAQPQPFGPKDTARRG